MSKALTIAVCGVALLAVAARASAVEAEARAKYEHLTDVCAKAVADHVHPTPAMEIEPLLPDDAFAYIAPHKLASGYELWFIVHHPHAPDTRVQCLIGEDGVVTAVN
jgi:hypothetical protein